MRKQLQDAGSYVRATASLSSIKARIFRVITATLGYWIGLEAISAQMNYTQFGDAVLKPVAVAGLIIMLIGAGSTAGGKK